MKIPALMISVAVVSLATVATATEGTPIDPPPEPPASHFECKDLGQGLYRPYWVEVRADGSTKDWGQTAKGLLGQNPMTSLEECDRARAAANDARGVICSRTGLDGWKPTLYTGTLPGRADFGYLGGSSIMELSDCLAATASSSDKGVCFWGGWDWYVTPIDHEDLTLGPYPTVDECILHTRADSAAPDGGL